MNSNKKKGPDALSQVRFLTKKRDFLKKLYEDLQEVSWRIETEIESIVLDDLTTYEAIIAATEVLADEVRLKKKNNRGLYDDPK